jgi:hypothetical protein
MKTRLVSGDEHRYVFTGVLNASIKVEMIESY